MKETKFKQTEVGLIPSDWEVVSLGNLVEMSSGTTPSRFNEKNFQGNVCWLSSGELKSHYIFNTKEKISTSAASSMRIYPKGTVVIAMYGLEAEGVRGTASILATESTISQACMAFSNLKRINNEFFYYWYAANGDVIGSKYAQGTKQQNLSPEVMKNVLVSLPPIEEQKRIAQALSDVDAVINTSEKLIAKKKALKQGTMQTLLSGKMRIQNGKWIKTTNFKQTELGPIPQEWEVKNLGEIAETFTGLTYSPDNVFKYGTLVLRSSNIQDGKLCFEDNVYVQMPIPQRAMVQENDILICVRNGSKALIGKSAFITKKAVGMAFGAFMTVLRTNVVSPQFLLYAWQSDSVQKQVADNLGATINQITNADFKNFWVIIPPAIEEQTAIATVLSDMDTEIAALETKLAKYRQLKTGMMQQLLTGKVRLV